MTKPKDHKILMVVRIGLAANIVLAFLKLTFGSLGNSQALFSDGLNSLSDVLISLMMIFALKISIKKPDYDHPYGHEKFEGLAYFVLGITFSITGLWILVTSFISIFDAVIYHEKPVPELYTLWIALISIVIKVGLVILFTKMNKKAKHPTIAADAKNHTLDVYATMSSAIGILMSQIFIYVDSIASVIISLFIFKLAIHILKESISYLTDQAPKIEVIQEISQVIFDVKGVLSVDDLKVRYHMTQKYVDVEIGVDANLSLKEAHQIAENVHHKVEDTYAEVIHCMVHVNPQKKSTT